MAFTVPKYQEIFESVAADNVLAIVARDMKRGLDYFYLDAATYTSRYGVTNGFVGTGEDLPTFGQVTLGQFVSLAFPALAVEPNANQTSDDDNHLDQELKLDLFIALTDASAAKVTRQLGKYDRALKAILRAATNADYCAGGSYITAVSIEINSDYGLIGKSADDGLYMRPAHLDLTIRFTER